MSKLLRARSLVARSTTALSIITILTTATISLLAQSAPPDLDAYVANSMKTFDVPGMAVAIVKDGKVVVAKGYGVRKLGDPTPVDDRTMFAIGSNTKAFTTAALAGMGMENTTRGPGWRFLDLGRRLERPEH